MHYRSFFFIGLIVLFSSVGYSQLHYQQDILGVGFLQTTIHQPDDYEGKVTCTLVKKVRTQSTKRGVLYIHGFNDYFFQSEMAQVFDSSALAFYALDLRKYGRSYLPHQKFNNVRNLEEYYTDIDTALRIMKQEGIEQILLVGHSTGGLIVSLYASHNSANPMFDAIFLNSPFFDFNLNPVLEKIGLPIIVNQGKKKPNKLMKQGLDPSYGQSIYKGDRGEWDYLLALKPHISPPVNYGWIKAIRDGQKQIHRGVTISKPVLVMHSDKSVYYKKWTDELYTADGVLSVKDISKYAKRIQGNVQTVEVKDGIHDLVLSRKEVRVHLYTELFTWLNSNFKTN
ncbi:MAG: alpha/beta hydrolase [Crocinitomicaceae bacterium]|nr:MAG: alpha/beta hydrolase [Crocinitomicaceae bacterium]